MSRADAIVLAGGRASRMGGIDKPGLVIGGRTLLETALRAVPEARRVVVVGPTRPDLAAGIRQVREEPAGSGPVAAVAAGLDALDPDAAPVLVVLAADMPFLRPDVITRLLSEQDTSGADAVFAADEAGRPQYLLGVWRHTALRESLTRLDTLVNQPMKALVPAHTVLVTLPDIGDVDTEEQVGAARARMAASDAPTSAGTTPAALTPAEARTALRANLTPLPARHASLREVRGAALAAPLHAAGPLPRFDVSAMDGYAVAGSGPWRLRADIGYAGGDRPEGLLPGEAVRIATGAHVPDGTSSVLRDEFTRHATDATDETGKILHRIPGTPQREDIRRRGEERETGDPVAATGTRVTPALVSAAASVEVTSARVRGPVAARLVMTGDEIRSDGPLRAGQTRDSIGPILPDVLAHHGIRTVDRVHLRDTTAAFDELLGATAGIDLLVVVGATGGGAADQLRAAATRAGARVVVDRLRMRPGGSTLVAELPCGTVLLGLPGNPFAALAVYMTLADAVVGGCLGAPAARVITGPLRNAAAVTAPVTRVVPARIAPEGGFVGDSRLRTSHLGGLIDRDGLVIVPPDATDDTVVEFLPLPS